MKIKVLAIDCESPRVFRLVAQCGNTDHFALGFIRFSTDFDATAYVTRVDDIACDRVQMFEGRLVSTDLTNTDNPIAMPLAVHEHTPKAIAEAYAAVCLSQDTGMGKWTEKNGRKFQAWRRANAWRN